MSINGITNLNQYAMMQMAKTQMYQQTQTSAVAAKKTAAPAKTVAQAPKPGSGNDIASRLARMPNFEQYEELIGRFLSGESEMENPGSGKPLTEDQIALRQFMREYQKSDTRSMSEIAASMQLASKNFLNFWQTNGNGGPPPGRILSADGTFKIFNSKEEKNEYIKEQKLDFLKQVMSAIQQPENQPKGGRDDKLSAIILKMQSGDELTAGELSYLKENSPETYSAAIKAAQERQAYKNELQRCKSKDEARLLHMAKISPLFTKANDAKARNDLMGAQAALAEATVLTSIFTKFTATREYAAKAPDRTSYEKAVQAKNEAYDVSISVDKSLRNHYSKLISKHSNGEGNALEQMKDGYSKLLDEINQKFSGNQEELDNNIRALDTAFRSAVSMRATMRSVVMKYNESSESQGFQLHRELSKHPHFDSEAFEVNTAAALGKFADKFIELTKSVSVDNAWSKAISFFDGIETTSVNNLSLNDIFSIFSNTFDTAIT